MRRPSFAIVLTSLQLLSGLAFAAEDLVELPTKEETLVPCEGKSLRLTDGSCAEVSTPPTRKADFTDVGVDGERVKPEISLLIHRGQAPFECPLEKFPNIQAWEQCLLGDKPPVFSLSPEVTAQIYSTLDCPENMANIAEIQQIKRTLRPENPRATIAALEGTPLNPRSTDHEPHLTLQCGYNFSLRHWFPGQQLYSNGKDSLISNGNRRFPKNCSRFKLVSEGTFELWDDCKGASSIRIGGRIGFVRYYAVDPNMRIEVAGSNPDGSKEFYWGLIFTPTREGFLREACRKKHSGDPIESLNRIVQMLMLKGDALERARKLTQKFAATAADLTPVARERMKEAIYKEFKALEYPLDRQISDATFEYLGGDLSKAGEAPCEALAQAVAERTSNKQGSTVGESHRPDSSHSGNAR